jgi:hypothetical protein
MFFGEVSLAAISDVVVINIMKLGTIIVRDVERPIWVSQTCVGEVVAFEDSVFA